MFSFSCLVLTLHAGSYLSPRDQVSHCACGLRLLLPLAWPSSSECFLMDSRLLSDTDKGVKSTSPSSYDAPGLTTQSSLLLRFPAHFTSDPVETDSGAEDVLRPKDNNTIKITQDRVVATRQCLLDHSDEQQWHVHAVSTIARRSGWCPGCNQSAHSFRVSATVSSWS